MSDIALDLNTTSATYRDLLVENGDLVIVDGLSAIQQHILQRIRVFAGEWFMDNTIGVPYFQEVFVKNPDLSKIDAIFLAVITQTPGVIAVTQYSFSPSFQDRRLTIAFRAQTTQGIVNYNGLVDF